MRRRRMRKLRARRKATGEHDRLIAIKLKRHGSSEASRLQKNLRQKMRKAGKLPQGAETDEYINDDPTPLPTEEAKAKRRMLERQRRAAIKATKSLVSTTKVPTPSRLKSSAAAYSGGDTERRSDEVLHLLGAKDQQNVEPVNTQAEEPMVDDKSNGVAVENGVSLSCAKQLDGEADATDDKMCDSRQIQQPAQRKKVWTSAIVEDDGMEEGQISPPPRAELHKLSSNNQETTDAEKNDMLLDMIPIPRKSTCDKVTAAIPASFVIPKRSGNIFSGQGATHLASRANGDVKHLEQIAAEMKSPISTSQLSYRSPIRAQRRRSKNVVPMKSSLFSQQDRMLMRLARKRNSILFALVELTAETPLDISKKVHLAGYDVYDVDGNVLSDLVPRLSCPTKHEMALNKDLFSDSFFGVSICSPRTEGSADSAANGSDDGERANINCYEQLRFERPEDREFYQRQMYGTTFVPQHLRGWTTLTIRRVRFERKSTGIRFNQERDREEFAASLSKRYTFHTSVPRCNIPRENWQKLMNSQLSTAYLHYLDRDAAERASHVFRDDLGNPLEMKLEYKAGVVISLRSHASPRRLYSRERSERELSPHPRSRSSSRPDAVPSQVQLDNSVPIDRPATSSLPATGGESRYNGQEIENISLHGLSSVRHRHKSDRDTNSQERTASPTAPSSFLTGAVNSADASTVVSEEEEGEVQEEGELDPSTVPMANRACHGEREHRRSPPRRWQQDVREQREYYAASREPARGYQSYNRHYNHRPDRRRSRSRSRPRDVWCESRHDNWGGSYADDRHHFRAFDPVEGYNNNPLDQPTRLDEMGHYSGREYQDRGYDCHSVDPYSRRY
ncbi:unnamed protein product [Phytophthora fragariaefolia]|uniref:Unnamed protein product n=1 Tax=Phytophthora fragariaefolia TaxID=1490495 RepID=A0A9W6YCC5_9STRA|nr:unnamed protein product [Phytophthora fragariaefolia]